MKRKSHLGFSYNVGGRSSTDLNTIAKYFTLCFLLPVTLFVSYQVFKTPTSFQNYRKKTNIASPTASPRLSPIETIVDSSKYQKIKDDSTQTSQPLVTTKPKNSNIFNPQKEPSQYKEKKIMPPIKTINNYATIDTIVSQPEPAIVPPTPNMYENSSLVHDDIILYTTFENYASNPRLSKIMASNKLREIGRNNKPYQLVILFPADNIEKYEKDIKELFKLEASYQAANMLTPYPIGIDFTDYKLDVQTVIQLVEQYGRSAKIEYNIEEKSSLNVSSKVHFVFGVQLSDKINQHGPFKFVKPIFINDK